MTLAKPPPGTYATCEVCCWEDDIAEGGANHVSLVEARANFERIGAVAPRFNSFVRAPRGDEGPRASALPQVFLLGTTLAGRTTLTQRLGGAVAPRDQPSLIRMGDFACQLQMQWRTSWAYDVIRDAHVDERVRAERYFVLTCDAFIFVADSQRERMEANLAFVDQLAATLVRMGRKAVELPLVFVHNKRDLPNIVDETEARAALRWPRCRHVFTVATRDAKASLLGAAIAELLTAKTPDARG